MSKYKQSNIYISINLMGKVKIGFTELDPYLMCSYSKSFGAFWNEIYTAYYLF